MGLPRPAPARHPLLRPVRRAARRAPPARQRRPPRYRRLRARHLLPDGGHGRQLLGPGSGRADGRRARTGGARTRRGRTAGAGDEHQALPAVRTQLRVLLRGPHPRRPHGRRPRPRHPVPGRGRHPEALRRQRSGTAPHGLGFRSRRGHHARDLPDRIRGRRARGAPARTDELLQPGQRHLRQRAPAAAHRHPAPGMGLYGTGGLRLGRLQ